ncbi:MAG: hypothetical protein FWH07_01360 [Oscillospiraceae bacterium]|nr:hypothetical protein [Oscillospiraceae bacterium]
MKGMITGEIFGIDVDILGNRMTRNILAWVRIIIRVLFYFFFFMVCYRRVIYVIKGTTFEVGATKGSSTHTSKTNKQGK